MKTNYGEIKSIRDLFEPTGEKYILNPESDIHVKMIIKKVKCKMCGDILEDIDIEGAVDSGWLSHFQRLMKDHIELHILLR